MRQFVPGEGSEPTPPAGAALGARPTSGRSRGAPNALLALLLAGCGAAPPAPQKTTASPPPAGPAPQAASSADAGAPAAASKDAAKGKGNEAPAPVPWMVTPSHLLPDLVGERGVVAREDGYRRVLVDRMRLVARDDGSLERGAQLLPLGVVTSIPLPTRLGGGFLFHANTAGGTQIWKATTWLARLEPVVQLSAVGSEVVAGFDRLYVRTNNRLIALDPQTGEQLPLAPLPPSSSYGGLAFADGWRAVVETDLRGPLATFDAGLTWRPVPVSERVTGVSVAGANPAITVGSGQYVLDERGGVTFRPALASGAAHAAADPADKPARRSMPLGPRPLRAALEDGWPDDPGTAVVARGGSLVRVSLGDGTVLATTEEAYPERLASCHAIRLGARYGFVCGERDGPTALYEVVAPLALRPVLRFARPRFVSPSGNGALVIRGPCTDEPESRADARAYCIRSASGATREILIKGERGLERVVALADGRVAVLVPPRDGSGGQLTLLAGLTAVSVPLALPAEPRGTARELRRGMWLEGVEEREPGVLGAWVEAGGPILGVRVALDGKVTAGEVRDDAGGVVLGGRFAISLGDGGRAAETTDGGFTWSVFDLPERDREATVASPTRACGPAGCALGGWVRVGWGKPAAPDDLAPADAPSSLYAKLRAAAALPFHCDPDGSLTPPLSDKPAAPAPAHGRPHVPAAPGRLASPPSGVLSTGWLPFRNTPPPPLGADELGLDNGAPYDTVPMHLYAWGKRGADWARTGRWLLRFDDRFDTASGARSSAVSASPWPDEALAAEAIGSTGIYGAGASWAGFLDPSGRAFLAEGCRAGACSFYAATEGQPVLPLRDANGRVSAFPRPLPHGAVRVGETWFFISSSGESVTLYRVDLGVVRVLAAYPRPGANRYGHEEPRLVRRASSTGLGLVVGTTADPGERSGNWYVLPIDPETGQLGEATLLTRKDLAGVALDRCAPAQDGWLLDITPEAPILAELTGGSAALDQLEMRLRLNPGSACVEGIGARLEGTFFKPTLDARGKLQSAPVPSTRPKADDGASIPLAATERGTGRRWVFRCTKKSSLFRR